MVVILINYAAGLTKYSAWGTVGVMMVLATIFGFLRRRTEKFVSGYAGEGDIDRELKGLDGNFVYISEGLDTGRGNIDKIVIGPTGVWVLEVKSHKGNITFDGQTLLRDGKSFENNFLSQAYAEAKTLEEHIKSQLNIEVPVQPVLVFSSKGAVVKLEHKKYRGVFVIQKSLLIKLISEASTQNFPKDIQMRIRSTLNMETQKQG